MIPSGLLYEILSKNALDPRAVYTNGTVNGTAVNRDVSGNIFNTIVFIVTTGVVTDGSHAITVEESDDNSSYTDAATADIRGTEPTVVAADDNKTFAFAYEGTKQYARLKIVTSGATTGGFIAAVAILGDPYKVPTQ